MSQEQANSWRYDGNGNPAFGVEGRGFTPLVSFGRRLIPNHLLIAGGGRILIAGAVVNGAYAPDEFTQFVVGKVQGDLLPVSPAASQGGCGGCGITRNSRIDPILPGLVLLAFLAFGARW